MKVVKKYFNSQLTSLDNRWAVLLNFGVLTFSANFIVYAKYSIDDFYCVKYKI